MEFHVDALGAGCIRRKFSVWLVTASTQEKVATAIDVTILISNFCRVLNVVCFLLGNSPASEF